MSSRTELLSIAAAMVRGTYVCEKAHRNGEDNPHIHFDDNYIRTGRQISDIARLIEEQIRLAHEEGYEEGKSDLLYEHFGGTLPS